MTWVECAMQDAAEMRLPDCEVAAPPAEPLTTDVFDDLRQRLERRAHLIELIVGREKAIEEAYDSHAENRITWARTEGAETLRLLRGGLYSCEAGIKHLCCEIAKEAE